MEIVVRATIIFFFLWLITRSLGKRELSEVTAFELLLLVTMGDLVQQGVTQEDMSVTGAVLAVGTLALWVLVFSWLAFKWRSARTALEGVPVVVVHDGRPVEAALRLERLALDEVLEQARKQGIEDLGDVRLGVLEPDGKISFLQRGDGGGAGQEDQQEHSV